MIRQNFRNNFKKVSHTPFKKGTYFVKPRELHHVTLAEKFVQNCLQTSEKNLDEIQKSEKVDNPNDLKNIVE